MNNSTFIKTIRNTDFCTMFANELDKTFPDGWIYEEELPDVFIGVDGTGGWYEALLKVLRDLNLTDLIEYYNELNWRESDYLDGLIEEEVVKKCFKDGKRIIK